MFHVYYVLMLSGYTICHLIISGYAVNLFKYGTGC